MTAPHAPLHPTDANLEATLRLSGRWFGACIYCGRPRCNPNAVICHYCARVELFAARCPCGRPTRSDLNPEGEWAWLRAPPRAPRYGDADSVRRIVRSGGGAYAVSHWLILPREVAERAWALADSAERNGSASASIDGVFAVEDFLVEEFRCRSITR